MNILQALIVGSLMILGAACGQGAEADAASTEIAEETPETKNPESDEPARSEEAEAQAEIGADLSQAPSGAYKVDQGHRYITFHYDHQGFSSPYVRWRNWDAELDWNAENPEQSSVSVTIDATSVDSGVDAFDKHLKSADFFDVDQYPTISFVSTKIDNISGDIGRIKGDLTIKGVTKPVTLKAKFNKGAYNERAKAHKIGFSAGVKLLRSDFDVDLAVPFVGDEVQVIIEAEFNEATSE